MSWFRRRKHGEEPAQDGRRPGLEEVSGALQNALRLVGEAVAKCSTAGETALPVARRELAGVLRESMGTLDELVRGVGPSSRIHRMARLTAAELVGMAKPWLVLDFMGAGRSSSTTAEMSELQRKMWSRAEELVRAAHEARGAGVTAAREGLYQLIDEVEVFSSALVATPTSERQRLMWQLAGEEIVGFVNEALDGRSEQREPH